MQGSIFRKEGVFLFINRWLLNHWLLHEQYTTLIKGNPLIGFLYPSILYLLQYTHNRQWGVIWDDSRIFVIIFTRGDIVVKARKKSTKLLVLLMTVLMILPSYSAFVFGAGEGEPAEGTDSGVTVESPADSQLTNEAPEDSDLPEPSEDVTVKAKEQPADAEEAAGGDAEAAPAENTEVNPTEQSEPDPAEQNEQTVPEEEPQETPAAEPAEDTKAAQKEFTFVFKKMDYEAAMSQGTPDISSFADLTAAEMGSGCDLVYYEIPAKECNLIADAEYDQVYSLLYRNREEMAQYRKTVHLASPRSAMTLTMEEDASAENPYILYIVGEDTFSPIPAMSSEWMTRASFWYDGTDLHLYAPKSFSSGNPYIKEENGAYEVYVFHDDSIMEPTLTLNFDASSYNAEKMESDPEAYPAIVMGGVSM
ncbi:MAG: hypothetical protein K6B12_03710, partial [Clostridiales bacterium]|nr:hypothetical protein [Clostridiales bacterium]